MSLRPGVFFGTPKFAASCLRALLEANLTPQLVVTQPDRPAGRNRQLQPGAVKRLALEHGLQICQPESLRNPPAYLLTAMRRSDCAIVVAYGQLLPRALLDIPKHGCWNLHASLLPRWRGAAPVQHALLQGDSHTGVCVMQMDAGLDTGPLLYHQKCAIAADDTTASLTARLARLGGLALVHCLRHADALNAVPQAQQGACYASKISKQQARINWHQSATHIERMVRAYNPAPVAYSQLSSQADTRLRIWRAQALEHTGNASKQAGNAKPGELLAPPGHKLGVQCGTGVLALQQIQLPGAQPLDIQAILNSRSTMLHPGTHLV